MNTPCAVCSHSITRREDAHVFHFRGRFPTIVCSRCEPHVRSTLETAAAATRKVVKHAAATLLDRYTNPRTTTGKVLGFVRAALSAGSD